MVQLHLRAQLEELSAYILQDLLVLILEVALCGKDLHLRGDLVQIAFLYRVSRIVPVTLLIFFLENHCKTHCLNSTRPKSSS